MFTKIEKLIIARGDGEGECDHCGGACDGDSGGDGGGDGGGGES